MWRVLVSQECLLYINLDFVNTIIILGSQNITVIRGKGKKTVMEVRKVHVLGNQLRLLLA